MGSSVMSLHAMNETPADTRARTRTVFMATGALDAAFGCSFG
jgi:hypothetical protein